MFSTCKQRILLAGRFFRLADRIMFSLSNRMIYRFILRVKEGGSLTKE